MAVQGHYTHTRQQQYRGLGAGQSMHHNPIALGKANLCQNFVNL